MTKTKIVATLGPATADRAGIANLIEHGVSVFRLNFSHGTLEDHAQALETINALRQGHELGLAVMGDLCGPKIRAGGIEPEGVTLEPGEEVVIEPELAQGSPRHFGANYAALAREVSVGHRVLIDDGQISLQVVAQQPDRLTCKVILGGPLYSHKGINLPDTTLSVPAITPRDWECADWAIAQQLDYLALSFVRTAEEVKALKDHIRRAGSRTRVVAKIEKPEAIANLESIVQATDALLAARGDLGVEMDLPEVPLLQKRMTALARRYGKPIIVATQMLQSMITQPTPTRAEVSDIANAVMDFADAVMLSGETAVGRFPLRAVAVMRQTAEVTEAYLDRQDEPRPRVETEAALATVAALARSVAQLIDDLGAKLVAVWSETGAMAQFLSKARIDVPIVAFSSDTRACQQMALHYGVLPVCRERPDDLGGMLALLERFAAAHGVAQAGDQVLVLPGTLLGLPGIQGGILMHCMAGTSP